MQSDGEECMLRSCFGSLKSAVMGCCYSICQKDTDHQENTVNERTHLLEVPEQQQQTPSPSACASTPPRKPDEQSALNRILHETATNVIDVGALGPYSLEAGAYSERVRAYTARAAGAALAAPARARLLADLPPAARRHVLAAAPLPHGDKELFAEDHPKLTKKYMSDDIDPTPIDHEIQDLKRTEYLTKYCSRELPFMSVNLARRARALQTLRLPDDIYIPDTSQKGSYRAPKPEKYAEPPSAMSMKPTFDNSLQKELRRILRVRSGDTSYDVAHALLARVLLEKNPFGAPREEPRFPRWKNPYIYTYRI